ncbi:MAG: ABC transporter substrate-binding protein, partial [Zetaproteobacteria bacterium]
MAAWALALVLMLPAAGHAVSIGIATEPATLDPRFGTDAASARIQELVHCRLVRVDEKGLPQPMLAQSWRRLDPYTWRFLLRRGWRFADGRPVRAQDIAATLNAARDPRLGSPLAAQLAEIAEIHAERDALVVRARTPDPMLPVRLSVGVLPEEAAHAPPMPRHPPSCGPYRMISWNNGVIRLAKTGNAPRTAPEGIVFRVVPDPTTRALKLARGELDLIQGDIPAHLVPFLRRRARIRLVARPSLTFAYIGLTLRKPPLSDRRVRQALAMGIARKGLIEGL